MAREESAPLRVQSSLPAGKVIGRRSRPWAFVRKAIVVGSAAAMAQSIGILALSEIVRRRRKDQMIRRLTQRLTSIREEEQRHIARELHDNIGQRLSLLSIRLDSLRDAGLSDEHADDNLLESMYDLSELISEVHGLSHSMHTTQLEQLGFEDGLAEMCRSISQAYRINADFQINGVPEKVNPRIARCFYRIAQEALNNVIKHSRATLAHVTLTFANDSLIMRVKDNGIGFDLETSTCGLGLVSIDERIQSIDGTVAVHSSPQQGTLIIAEAPLVLADSSVDDDLDSILVENLSESLSV
jgi:signal transduction histidine kinase